MTGFKRTLFSTVLILMAGASCAPVSKLPKVDDTLAAVEAQKQRELVLKNYLADYRRIHSIAFKIFENNTDLCGPVVGNSIGIKIGTGDFLGKDYKKAAESLYGFSSLTRVWSVAKGSPADEAGMKVNDILVSINGWSIPAKEEESSKITEKMQQALSEDKTIEFVVLTDGETQKLSAHPKPICQYGVFIEHNDAVNAFADSKSIYFTTGMMRLATTETELATVVGHEVAHNLMDHIPKKEGNQAIGLIFDLLFAGLGVNTQGAFTKIGARAYSQEFEAEADYVGLYLMARSGYAVDDSPNFWRNMAIAHPSSIKTNHASSHPATPHRFVALEKTVEEIKRKKAAGKALIPDAEINPSRKSESEEQQPFGP